jgi:hypothetical protein
MATVSVIKLKVRRGTDTERRQITLDTGELGYTTDVTSRRLFVGDGSTRGGSPAGIKFFSGNIQNPDPSLTTAQVGDIVFNTTDNKLYALSGVNLQNFPNYTVPAAYQFIGPRVDDSTIVYDAGGHLTLKDNAVTNTKVDNSVFDYANGFTRPAGNGPVAINYDNNTIKIVSGALTVNPAAINLASINTRDQAIDAFNIAFQNLPGAPGVAGSYKLWKDAGGFLRVS